MDEAVIIAACRTPIGKFGGALSALSATELGAVVVREAVRRAGVAQGGQAADIGVDEVVMGNVISAGLGQAPARQAALGAGLPHSVAALTINKVCGSGLKAVMLAAQAVRLGDARVVVAGGMESMSRAPYLLPGARGGGPRMFGNQELIDAMLHDGLRCAFAGCPMGQHAEHTARTSYVTRQAQDEYAVESQRRAAQAIRDGIFAPEIVPVTLPAKKGESPAVVQTDEGPRPGTTLESLARLKPAFEKDGTVTAGNASLISDGAAAVIVTSAAHATVLGAKPIARIVAYATAGVAPEDLFIAPVPAIRAVLDKARLKLRDIDLIELNEAFAVQTVACMQELQCDAQLVNVHGGAIALGHPIGASGARVLVTLLHAMQRRNVRRGLAALCLGGGNAVAMIVERD